MGAFVIPSIFTAVDRLTAPIRKMGRGVQAFAVKAQSAVARLDRAFRKLTPSIGGLGRELLAFASAAVIIAQIRRTTSVVTGFETALIGVGKTTGADGVLLKQLGVEIVNTSNSLRTIESDKLLELAQAAGQLGIKGNEDILKFSSTLAQLEKASDIQGAEGATKIARLLTITGEGPGVVDKFASSLVALGNSVAATEGEILRVSSEVARSTAAYRLTSDEILGIAATLKSLDVRPEAAGTAVGKVFRAIELSTIKGGKVLNKFGEIMKLTPIQVKEAFQESPKKAFTTFIAGLNRISKEGGSVNKALIDVGLSGEIVSKGIIPLATNFELLGKIMETASTGFEKNTALTAEFNASQKTVASATTSIVRAFDNFIIKQATAGSGLDRLQNALFFVSDNMETIVTVAGFMVAGFVSIKLVILAATLILGAYNIALGVSSALSATASVAVGKNAVALAAYTVVTKAVTAAQWLWNAAMTANPIGLIIVAIAALVGFISIAIMKWDEWGAAVTFIMGPLGLVISVIQSFRKNWDMVVTAFKTDGIVAGFKAVGRVLLDAVLMPLQMVFKLLSKLPDFLGGGFAQSAVNKIQTARDGLGVDSGTGGASGAGGVIPAINPEKSQQEALVQSLQTTQNASVSIDIKDPNNRTDARSSDDFVKITTGSTME